MSFNIAFKQGSEIKIMEVHSTPLVVGRVGADIEVSDPTCSRRHALIFIAPDGALRVRDLGSCNGTFVNGERVTEVSLDSGDCIEVANIEILIRRDPASDNDDSLVCHTWPENYQALPKEKQTEFELYY